MKKIVVLFSVFLIVAACNPEDNSPDVTYELQPVQNVILPDTISAFDDNNITVEYLRPTTCHGFDGFLYEKNELTRTIAVQTYFFPGTDCQPLTNEVKQETFNFHPNSLGTYKFRFWQGKDSNGNDIFLEFERPSKFY